MRRVRMGEKRQTTANDEKALREWLSRGAAKPNQSDMVNFKEALGSISPKIRPGPSLIPGSQIFSVLSVRVDG